MEINKYIGNKIRELRERKNLTQEELAEYLETTAQTISRYEIGDRKTNQDILFKLAEFFKISINDFFPPLSFENSKDELPLDELDLLWSKYKDDLTEDGKDMIKFMLLKKKKEIDEQENNN